MKFSDFALHFKSDKSPNKNKVIVSGFLVVIITMVLVGLIWFIGGQNNGFNVTEAEIQKQTAFINGYKNKENEFNEFYKLQPKPVMRNEIDVIQNSILRQAKDYKLNVTTLSSIPNQNNNPNEPFTGQEFELSISGYWDMTAKFLDGFQKSNALISIRSLKMESDKNEVKTTIKYKVYFLEG